MERIVDQKMTVQKLGSGWAAVHMVLVKDDKLGSYWDVQQTGIGRYPTREQAMIEAEDWSESDEIPLI